MELYSIRPARPELVKPPTPFSYTPLLSERERAAYHAAHRILTEQAPCASLACPGGRRTAQLDHIAKIILETSPHG